MTSQKDVSVGDNTAYNKLNSSVFCEGCENCYKIFAIRSTRALVREVKSQSSFIHIICISTLLGCVIPLSLHNG